MLGIVTEGAEKVGARIIEVSVRRGHIMLGQSFLPAIRCQVLVVADGTGVFGLNCGACQICLPYRPL